ncbi:MAG: tetratricopeptide repeat protein [Luteolibacter sp.]
MTMSAYLGMVVCGVGRLIGQGRCCLSIGSSDSDHAFGLGRHAWLILLAVFTPMLLSCGNSGDAPVLSTDMERSSSKAAAMYQSAKTADERGKVSRAIKFYGRTADRFPLYVHAPQARFREAGLLEKAGKHRKAFDAYDQMLEKYPADSRYPDALERLASIANDTADGRIQSSFLGMKRRVSSEQVIKMLDRVKEHAPRSALAAQARFRAGELHQSKKKFKEAIGFFRELVREQPDSSLAPEALFRVGEIFLEQAKRGNQSLSTLDLAKESFNDYLIQYPGHSRNGEARKMIADLERMQHERSLEIVDFYIKTGRKESARIYLNDLIRSSRDGPVLELAKEKLKNLDPS